MKYRGRSAAGLFCVLALLAVTGGARAQQDAAAEKVAAIKQSFQASMAALHSYEWIETVTVSVDGDQKSQKQNRCYYGADGKQEKVPVAESSGGGRKPRGIRGRVVARKTDEMEDYVQQAVALIKQYVPPDPNRIEAIKAKGAQTLTVMDNATKMRATFPDYAKPGDALNVDVDPNGNKITAVSVASYIGDDASDAVTLDVTFGTFQDGTSYPAKIVLHGAKKKLDLVVENDGYRKTGS